MLRHLFLRCAIAAVALTCVVGGAAAPSATAEVAAPAPVFVDGGQVAAGMSDCPLSYVCIWADENFSGGMGKWQDPQKNYGAWTTRSNCLSGTWNDCASSAYNNGRNCNLTFYDLPDYQGAQRDMLRGSYLAYMTQNQWSRNTGTGNINDRFSSHKWCTF